MREIKFEYIITMANGEVKKTILTLEQIEQGVINAGVVFANSIVRRQYTGLKDKNGKDIYEGDILRHESWVGKDSYINYVKVKWHGVYRVFNADISFEMMLHSCNEKFEIIGNIYENHELLEGN